MQTFLPMPTWIPSCLAMKGRRISKKGIQSMWGKHMLLNYLWKNPLLLKGTWPRYNWVIQSAAALSIYSLHGPDKRPQSSFPTLVSTTPQPHQLTIGSKGDRSHSSKGCLELVNTHPASILGSRNRRTPICRKGTEGSWVKKQH